MLLVCAKITLHESVVIYHQCINQLIFIINSLVVLKKKKSMSACGVAQTVCVNVTMVNV